MTTITINAFDFQALQLFIAKKDVRHWLNGFHVNREWLAATDGKVLMRIFHGCDVGEDFPEHGYILEPVKVATKRAPDGNDPVVTLSLERQHTPMASGAQLVTPKLELSANNSPAVVRLEFQPGQFPDIERIIPNRDTAKPVANYFNPEYFELVGKAAKLLCKGMDIKDGMVTTLGESKQATLFKIPQRADVDIVVMPMNPREWGDV